MSEHQQDTDKARDNLGSFPLTAGTIALSRVLGFIREVLLANLFGGRVAYEVLVIIWRLLGTLEVG